MAKSGGRVLVAGQFLAGVVVSLWRVAGEHVLRHEGGELVDTKRVGDDGCVTFVSGVEPGVRYIAFGYNGADGPVSVRCRGLADGEVAEFLAQSPVQVDVVKHADGQVVDGVYVPVRDEPPAVIDDGADVEDDDAEPDEAESADETSEADADPAPLTGKALADRVKELGIEGASKMTADEKRDAVAKAEQDLAAA